MLKKMLNLTTSKSKKNDVSNALVKLEKVSEIIPKKNALDFFEKLQDSYNTYRVTETEIKKIEAQRDVLITEITKRYDLYHTIFDRIFEERGMAISKSFEIIDEGLKNNDRELVNIGMQGLSKVVSTSPFANVDQLAKMIQSNNIIEI